MIAKNPTLRVTLLFLMALFIFAAPARGSNQFKVRLSIVSQCGPQPGVLFGPGQAGFNIACLSTSTVFGVQIFSRNNFGASSGQSASNANSTGGIIFTAPSVNLLSPPLPSESVMDIAKVVYVVF